MFARSVSIRLKTNSVAEFTRLIENRRPSGASETTRLPGRTHVRRPWWRRSGRDQFVG